MKKLSLLFLIILVFASCSTKITPVSETKDYKTYVYKTIDTIQLTLNVYYPEKRQLRKSPAIIFYFGGGWVKGTPAHFHHQCKYLASRGMIAIAADYRTKSKYGNSPAECIMDAKSAIRWVKINAAVLGIDKNKIVSAGGSAGGHLAACMGTHIEINDLQDDLSISTMPAAMVLFNPVINVKDSKKASVRFEDIMEIASPFHNVQKDCPPTIIFVGCNDSTAPMKFDLDFQKKVREMGVECDVKSYLKQTHGFFNYGRFDSKYYYETVLEMDLFLQKHGFINGKHTNVSLKSIRNMTDTLVKAGVEE